MKAKFGICTAIATIIFNTGAAPLISQAPTATGQASLQPDVETISLDLAVRDRHNRPILDLKPEELTVADNGKPAKLANLRLENGGKNWTGFLRTRARTRSTTQMRCPT